MFYSRQGQEIFRFSIRSRPALGPTQWVPVRLPRVAHHQPLSIADSAEVKNDGAIPLLPRKSSWHGA
jgi:hypothetical protein